MIHFDKVFKEYKGQSFALENITITIPDGDFVFLIGPSGAGKTTLLRLLLRDTIPSSGRIIIDETHVHSMSAKKVHLLRRKIGMIFQDFKLLADRTIFENVALGLEIFGKKRNEIERGVNDVLDLVGLVDKKQLYPTQLSAGEKQRVSIARAIVAGPKILLADEPTGNLDPETTWGILQILEQINKLGTTVIMATHNVSAVNDMKKRTVTIHGGKIVSDEIKGKYHVLAKHKEQK